MTAPSLVVFVVVAAFGIGYVWGRSVAGSRALKAHHKGWTLEDFYRKYHGYEPPKRYPDRW